MAHGVWNKAISSDFLKDVFTNNAAHLSGNATTAIPQISPLLLEALIPGYGTLSRYLVEVLGFDITLIVSISLVIFALARSTMFLWNQSLGIFTNSCMSTVMFESDTDLYSWFMDWVAEKGIGASARSVTATAGGGQDFDFDDGFVVDFDDDVWDFTPMKNKVPEIKYEPDLGSNFFWHQSRLFRFSRNRSLPRTQDFGFLQRTSDIIETRVSCVGRSTVPIKELLQHVASCHHAKSVSRTYIKRPAPKKVREDFRHPWTTVTTRPSRPLGTVVLDAQQKSKILDDIAQYLSPKTAQWYSDRGLPYRRGYLLHGPPGTGKSSLAFAIAGTFQLDVYCLSLQDPTISEEDLASLFNHLPRQCVVVIEDIDSAGIKNRGSSIQTNPTDTANKTKSASEGSQQVTQDESHISLSGLLNVIDGIASKEGRILMVTTNSVNELDPALIRPGRIDLMIEFKLTTKENIRDLFKLMFRISTKLTGEKEDLRVEDAANQFSDAVPADSLSAAEIQGYLLTKKNSVDDALGGAEEWVKSTLAKKPK